MASLWKAIKNFIRGKRDQAAEKLKDDERDGLFAIQDSKKQIAEFTTKIATLMAENNRIEKRKNNADLEVQKWNSIAEKAASKGDEASTRTALQNKGNAKKTSDSLSKEIDRTKKLIDNLRGQLNSAKDRISKAESNLTTLGARNQAAKIRQELAKATTDFNSGDSPLAALDNLEKAVEKSESEAEAWEEMGEDSSPDQALEDKYGSGSSDVEDELAELMKKNKKS